MGLTRLSFFEVRRVSLQHHSLSLSTKGYIPTRGRSGRPSENFAGLYVFVLKESVLWGVGNLELTTRGHHFEGVGGGIHSQKKPPTSVRSFTEKFLQVKWGKGGHFPLLKMLNSVGVKLRHGQQCLTILTFQETESIPFSLPMQLYELVD